MWREGGEGKNASHQTILSAKLLTSKSIQNMFMTNTCLLKSLFVTFLKYLLRCAATMSKIKDHTLCLKFGFKIMGQLHQILAPNSNRIEKKYVLKNEKKLANNDLLKRKDTNRKNAVLTN